MKKNHQLQKQKQKQTTNKLNKKPKCTSRFTKDHPAHKKFITFIRRKKWNKAYLPLNDPDLLKFQKEHDLTRKQVKNKYEWYLSTNGLPINKRPRKSNHQQKVKHNNYDYKITNVEYDKQKFEC